MNDREGAAAWLEHQRKRWMRPNAHLFTRADACRFMPPGAPRDDGGMGVMRRFRPEPKNEAPARVDDTMDEQALAASRDALRRLQSTLATLKAELKFRRAFKAGFNPDQPRVPAGNPDGGQWTNADFSATDVSGSQRHTPQVVNAAQTGISTIDRTTESLTKILAQVVDTLPSGFGPLYGIAVHVAFGTAVRLHGLEGIGFWDVEHSFGGDNPRYGAFGSIRTDVVLRNEVGDIIAIYDVKTGDSTLRPSRVGALRAKTGVGPRAPVIELHVLRGVSIKLRNLRGSFRTRRRSWAAIRVN
jgi:hypothetical protein